MKFKVGDKVKVVTVKRDFKERYVGEEFTIRGINPNGTNIYTEPHYSVSGVTCPYVFFESELEAVVTVKKQKIVITTDGKITTAKLFENRVLIKAAEAKCHPEDTFDFKVGAKLAVDRLIGTPIGEQKPVEVDGFKVGDRVHVNGHNGTIICIAHGFEPNIGVEFDDGFGFHNCEGFELRDGNYGTKHSSSWRFASELTHGEVPKYYNGKVVCITNYYEDRTPISGFTIGNVYTVTNGVIVNDTGFVSMQYRDIESLCGGMGNTFIPFVEN